MPRQGLDELLVTRRMPHAFAIDAPIVVRVAEGDEALGRYALAGLRPWPLPNRHGHLSSVLASGRGGCGLRGNDLGAIRSDANVHGTLGLLSSIGLLPCAN